MKSTSILDGIFNPIPGESSSSSLGGISKPISANSLNFFSICICKPIPNIIHQEYHFRRVQISGHSSVQSSSTFRSRKADKPIHILRSKKIEQGQLLYPKIFPLIFLKTLQEESPNGSSLLKSWSDKLSPKTVNPKLGFYVTSRSLSQNYLKFYPTS